MRETLVIEPVSGAVGAEVKGVDLGQDLDNRTFSEIHRAFLDHQVIFFRDQQLTPQQQLAFAERFGPVHIYPYADGLPECPGVLEIRKTPGDDYTFGNVWHTDQSYMEKPPLGTCLYAKTVPPFGGDTLFVNTYAAYEALSAGMQAMLEGLQVWNAGDRNYKSGGSRRATQKFASDGMTLKQPDAEVATEACHPLVRTHPETGRKALYFGIHSQCLEGFTEVESAPLLDYLYRHCQKPEFGCRFRWAEGALALWDNRCTQHYAVADYQSETRVMHRVTVAGDRPF